MDKMTTRVVKLDDIATAKVNGKMIIEGYALKFNKESYIGTKDRGFYEVIRPEALAKTDLSNVYFCMHHDLTKVYAGTKNGSLILKVDDIGLWYNATIIDTANGRDFYKQVEERLLTGMSFKAYFEDVKIRRNLDGALHSTVMKLTNFREISITPFPTYKDTEAYTRSQEFESFEREYKRLKSMEQIAKLDELLKK